jgi:hypothetical protein
MSGSQRPLQNRVTPFGDVIAIAQRGRFIGNRGIIRDPATKHSSGDAGRRCIEAGCGQHIIEAREARWRQNDRTRHPQRRAQRRGQMSATVQDLSDQPM